MRRDLVERAMAGDHDAFSELARISIGRLYATACLILRDDRSAEDATQEALVAAWRDLSALRDPDRFEAWLHRLLVRACYREAGADDGDGRSSSTSGGTSGRRRSRDSTSPTATSSSAVSAASMPTSGRSWSFTTTSACPSMRPRDALGVPPGTVRSRLHRATRAMRAALDADARRSDHRTNGGRHDDARRFRPPPHCLVDGRAPRRASPSRCSGRSLHGPLGRVVDPPGASPKGGSPCPRSPRGRRRVASSHGGPSA